MFSPHKHWFLCVFLYILNSKTCCSEPGQPPSLVLYSPGEPEYTDVLVRRVGDNLTLVCEMKPPTRVTHIWNYVRNGTLRESVVPVETSSDGSRSVVRRGALSAADSGRYLCSAPPFSVSKYVLVQQRGEISCARGAFWCGVRCVLVAYVCDGRTDCLHGEDERAPLCPHNVCDRADKLNCTSGRCISAAACCRAGTPLCQQPSCCDQHMPRSLEVEPEYPALFEDRRAPDDYGFIQSTIYTVTACALIFMIAVVLLVSAICKMQMKRAALRGYTHADRAASHHYSVAYHQTARFPPCYEAARLLPDGPPSPVAPPAPAPASPPDQCGAPGRGLARLSAIFSSRYRQVPLPSSDLPSSPAHARALDRRLTLQLGTGRFQVSLGRFGRPRADTPTVAALELDMLHLSPEHYADAYSDGYSTVDTYTLNGRTVRLLGADIDTYEPEPPCYNDLQRYKQLGPPPEYLSRERLPCDRGGDAERSDRHEWQDRQAATNVELPPGYHELGAGAGWACGDGGTGSGESGVIGSGSGESGVIGSGSGESGVIGSGSGFGESGSGESASGSAANEEACTSGNAICHNRSGNLVLIENEINRARDTVSASNNMLYTANATVVDIANGNVAGLTESNIETLSSIIDNLPAIDSDVNANDSDMINHVIRDPINSSNTVIHNHNTVQNDNTLQSDNTLNNHSVVIINNANNVTNDTAVNNNA